MNKPSLDSDLDLSAWRLDLPDDSPEAAEEFERAVWRKVALLDREEKTSTARPGFLPRWNSMLDAWLTPKVIAPVAAVMLAATISLASVHGGSARDTAWHSLSQSYGMSIDPLAQIDQADGSSVSRSK